MNKKAFTLVELIVVVTILAILSTIWFISYQWYSISTRDWNRAISLQWMQKILELAKVQEWEYPEPTWWINVTYTWSTVWTQGTFWDEISINVDWVDKKSFVDPLTKLSYVYSRLNTNLEYEIAWIYEWDKIISKINLSNNTYAAWTEVSKAVVIWNYNKQVASVKKWTRTFILAVPTIISWDITLTRIEDLIAQDKLVYDWFKNLPSNYRDSEKFNPDWEVWLNLINDTNLVVFSWSITSLQDENNQITFVENLQKAYEYTDIEWEEEQEIILSYNPVTNEEWTKYLAQTIINDYVSKKVKVTAKNETSKDVEYFGSNSQFTKHWNNNTCENRNMNIVEVNPWTDVLAQTLDPNTIYIFNSWDYIFSHSLNMDDCSALIWKWTTTLYSNTSLTIV